METGTRKAGRDRPGRDEQVILRPVGLGERFLQIGRRRALHRRSLRCSLGGGWNSGLRGYSRAMRFSAVVALGLACLGTFLGLAACGGGAPTGTPTHPAGAAAPQGKMRAPQSRREQTRRTAAATRARARKAAAARARAQQARRRAFAVAHKPHVALPPAAAVRAASLPTPALPEPLLLGFQDDSSFRWSPDRQRMLAVGGRRPVRGCCARTSTGGRWRRQGRRTRATRSTAPTTSPTSTSCSGTRQQRGLRILLTIWGTPPWANGDAGHNHAPTQASGTSGTSPTPSRSALLRHACRLPVRALLLGLERAESRAGFSCRSTTVAAGRWRLRSTRGCTAPAYAGIKSAEPRRRGSRSARPRRVGATTSGAGHLPQTGESPGRFARSSRASVHAFASMPGRTTRTRPRPASRRPRSLAGRT